MRLWINKVATIVCNEILHVWKMSLSLFLLRVHRAPESKLDCFEHPLSRGPHQSETLRSFTPVRRLSRQGTDKCSQRKHSTRQIVAFSYNSFWKWEKNIRPRLSSQIHLRFSTDWWFTEIIQASEKADYFHSNGKPSHWHRFDVARDFEWWNRRIQIGFRTGRCHSEGSSIFLQMNKTTLPTWQSIQSQ